MAARRSNGALRVVVVLSALAAAATTALLPLATTSPCAHPLSRAILVATGLDPYLLSCTAGGGGTASSGAPLVDGGAASNNTARRARRPIVTDQRCATGELPPFALPPFHCCPPPSSSEPIPFTFPDPASPLRTRRPAHAAGEDDHMAKYARAVALMKALPASDPRSFHQQANIHCAYCTGAHRQAGRPEDDEVGVEVHFSWLFFPFHRAYLYFFERIAAKLLGDPTFALPFWNWDVPEGMSIPTAFANNSSSPLHDPKREPRHAPPRLADLDFAWGAEEKNLTDDDQVTLNLRLMHRQMVNVPPTLFLGQPYRAGDAPMPGPGTLEWAPHNTMHVWTGDQSMYNVEDMGVYYSAGRDPIFYAHHANIDRLWELWRRRRIAAGGRPDAADLDDPDWLDSSFLLYDEEARLVRVAVRDVLDVGRLRYTYDDGGGGARPPWLDARPPVTPGVNPKGGRRVEAVRFPMSLLDKAVTTEVRRPPGVARRRRWRWRSMLPEEKKPAREEVLVVEGIEAEAAEFVRFDVYVNAREFQKVPPGGREMAGSFTTLKRPGGKVVRTSMRVALSELLEDLGAGGDDSVTVTLVPVRGNVTIGGLTIVYMEE